ncbi:MAG: 2-C-methyl-D-erythritol 4-phosphate cytidylyltransferase [Desulfobacterales bacterium]|nr:2-C-methyl-D-erythritol 4-phosphate cytidylyltransferase [Desulfobacterales bacterium]MBF0395332.1 2-C-methyl-D-erythritol 4-phosphate cytidylyltransferase [Desulfobacterales bacterium]
MVIAIIVAAGKGTRMKDSVYKQYLSIGDMPILSHTLFKFDICNEIDEIIIAIPKEDFNFCYDKIILPYKFQKKIDLISGGIRRQDSVYNALNFIKDLNSIVVIHDGVRPFVNVNNIQESINIAKKHGACILGIPVFDTLKSVDSSFLINKTIPREKIWFAQTPQVFHYDIIKKAHEIAIEKGISATDDASLVEYLGKEVKIILGTRFNFKITTKEDLEFANSLLLLKGENESFDR